MGEVERRELVLHIGASKTGTSALQVGLLDSVEALAAQDIGMPLPHRRLNVRRLLRPLGWRTGDGFVGEVDHQRLGELTDLLRRTPGRRLLISCEDLCEAGPAALRALTDVADAAGLRVRAVLSVRSLASVIPSEWQQFLKHRLVTPYPEFLDELREGSAPVADKFWRRQDAVAITRQWAEAVGDDAVEVVVTPDRATDPDGLYRIFGELVGFDPATISWPTTDVNGSWGYVEAEVYRRLNVALGERLADYERQYQPAVRRPLVKGVLSRGASDRIPLPPEHLDWVAERATTMRDGLRRSGHKVHGDLDALVPLPGAARELPALDETAIAAAAIRTLAAFSVFVHFKPGRGPATSR